MYNGDDSDDEDEDPDASRCQRRRRANNAAGAAGPSVSSAGARRYPLAPALIPTRSVTGHLDWVFGLDWITERHLVTGSRDRTLALWVSFSFFSFWGERGAREQVLVKKILNSHFSSPPSL